ncbi:YdeI/OmpD-associated family protein [Streptomyces sp. NPDC002896]|uniref:YdeI/OmpD-associated family protein n=1 Tax=Streptomyces sp. NPDC002896 TaxID=3154438 RepID=UPI003330DE60
MTPAEHAGPGPQPTHRFADQEAWTVWLEEYHDQSSGVWLRIAKKGTGETTVTVTEALDMALCFGWIDGQRKREDDTYFLQRYCPRRPRSTWSQINREKVRVLTERGLMRPAGLREVERAKTDGRWEAAYAGQAAATVPEDLQAALDADPVAAAFYAGLDSRNRYALYHRLQTAKRAETRARRLAQFVEMLREGRKFYE